MSCSPFCYNHQLVRRYRRSLGRRPVRVHVDESLMDDNTGKIQHVADVNKTRNVFDTQRRKQPEEPIPNFENIEWNNRSKYLDDNQQINRSYSDRSISKGDHMYKLETKRKFAVNLPAGFKCEFLDEGDRRYGPVLQAAKSRLSREKHNLILLEGKRLIRDAIRCGANIKYIYFNRYEDLEDLPLEGILDSTEFFKMRYHHLKLYSDVQTLPGVMAVSKKPELSALYNQTLGLTLVCDNIRDPGNMGTLLRSAAACGARQVLATKGCTDIWDPKVLRSGAGAHFHIPIFTSVAWETMPTFILDKPYVFLAEQNTASHEENNNKVNELLLQQSSADPEEEDGGLRLIKTETGQKQLVDYRYSEENAEAFRHVPLVNKPFYSVDYVNPGGETLLIVGGETEGLSAAAYKFAYDNFGCKVSIPMTETMDCLNASVAGSIVLFEAKKQMLLRKK